MKTKAISFVLVAVFAVVAVAAAAVFFVAPRTTASAQVNSLDARSLYVYNPANTYMSSGPRDTDIPIDAYVTINTYPNPYDASSFHNVKHYRLAYISGSRSYYFAYFTENAITLSGFTVSGQTSGDIRFIEPESGSNYAQYWSGSEWMTINSGAVYMTSAYSNYGNTTLTGTDLSQWLWNVKDYATLVKANYLTIDDTPSFIDLGPIFTHSWTSYTGPTSNDVPTHYNTTTIHLYKITNPELYEHTYADGAFAWQEVVLQYQITMVGADDGITYTYGGQDNDTYWTIRTYPGTDGGRYFTFNVPSTTTELKLRYYGGDNWYTLTQGELNTMKQDYANVLELPSTQYSQGWNDGVFHQDEKYQAKLGVYYGMDMVQTVFTKIGEILNLQIFGNIPLYTFFLIPLIMGVVYVVLKFAR